MCLNIYIDIPGTDIHQPCMTGVPKASNYISETAGQ